MNEMEINKILKILANVICDEMCALHMNIYKEYSKFEFEYSISDKMLELLKIEDNLKLLQEYICVLQSGINIHSIGRESLFLTIEINTAP